MLTKALKTYNQYHTDCLIAEGKLKEAERLEERHTGKSADLGLSQSGGQRRSSVKKMERLMEKVCEQEPESDSTTQEVLKWFPVISLRFITCFTKSLPSCQRGKAAGAFAQSLGGTMI